MITRMVDFCFVTAGDAGGIIVSVGVCEALGWDCGQGGWIVAPKIWL